MANAQTYVFSVSSVYRDGESLKSVVNATQSTVLLFPPTITSLNVSYVCWGNSLMLMVNLILHMEYM